MNIKIIIIFDKILGEILFLFFISILLLILELIELYMLLSILRLIFGKENESKNQSNFIRCSFLFCISKCLYSIILRNFEFYSSCMSIKIFSSFNKIILEKFFKMIDAPKNKIGLESLLSYFKIESANNVKTISNLICLVMIPIKIFLYLIIIFELFGVPLIIGVLFHYVLQFINLKLDKNYFFFEKKYREKVNARKKVSQTIINNIKTIKFNVWEKNFFKRVRIFSDIIFKI